MRRWFMIAAMIIGASGQGFTPTPPPPAPGYHLSFSEDFRHFDLSPDGRGAHTWYEGVWFSHHHAPAGNIVRTADGLRLSWTRGQQQPDTSISTFSREGATTRAWRYGYYEVRLRWTPVPGAWPAAWLIPNVAGHMRESGELDIFEGDGSAPQTFFGTLHHWQENPTAADRHMEDRENTGRSNRFRLPFGINPSEFHTYGMLWEPSRVTWFFDDKPLHSEAAYPIFGQQNYSLVIGMQEGSNWKEGSLDGVSAQRMDLDVQWVRIWQR